MVISTLYLPAEELDREKTKMGQFGGGGSLEEQCGSITFEDIFIYNQAVFEVRVNEDWKSAQVDARAWINWTLADDIERTWTHSSKTSSHQVVMVGYQRMRLTRWYPLLQIASSIASQE